MKRVLTLCISIIFCISVCSLPAAATSDPYANIHVNTGDQTTDLIGVAKTQVGYIEGSLTGDVYNGDDNVQKYGAWYDENVDNIGAGKAAWDATFVAWCANQADIPDTIIPRYVYAPYSVSWYEEKGLFELAQSRDGTYIPKAGDLIYFAPAGSTLASQMGIVIDVTDTYVYTIEGNTFGQSGEQVIGGVHAKSYNLTYSRIYGYATPEYETDPYANTHINTGDGAGDLVGVAETQVGYLEGSLTGDTHDDNNYQKYGVWYDEAVENLGVSYASWEGAFVAWCANQAGVPDTVIPRHAYVPNSSAWYENKGLFYDSQAQGGSYIPKKGDLIYFVSSGLTYPTHIGIVTEVTDTYVRTIEGNATDPSDAYGSTQGVFERQYNLNYSRIYGYATPQYELVFDITGDGQVSTSDARELLMCVLNNSMQKNANMDVDRNGEINTADARELLMKVIQG